MRNSRCFIYLELRLDICWKVPGLDHHARDKRPPRCKMKTRLKTTHFSFTLGTAGLLAGHSRNLMPTKQVSLLDRDMGGKKDEALGEVFIPIASFKEPKVCAFFFSLFSLSKPAHDAAYFETIALALSSPLSHRKFNPEARESFMLCLENGILMVFTKRQPITSKLS